MKEELSLKKDILEAELKKQVQFLNDINNAIRKLRADKKTTIGNIHRADAALQAYKESLQVIEQYSKEGSDV